MLVSHLRGERVLSHSHDHSLEGIPLHSGVPELLFNECKLVPEILNLRTRAVAVHWWSSGRGRPRGVHLGLLSPLQTSTHWAWLA